jgi:hypothetical protein
VKNVAELADDSFLYTKWQEQGISFVSSVNPLSLYILLDPDLPLENSSNQELKYALHAST